MLDETRYEEVSQLSIRLADVIHKFCEENEVEWYNCITLLMISSIQVDGRRGFDLMAEVLAVSESLISKPGIKAGNRRLRQLEAAAKKQATYGPMAKD